jgi:5-hydroxyisourate hydrolase
MTTLTTHVLDVAAGKPAAGIGVTLARIRANERCIVAEKTTNADGRTDEPLGSDLEAGTYELVFAVGPYFAVTGRATFYDEVPVRVVVEEGAAHYHVPLLLSPFGYSTYRGS